MMWTTRPWRTLVVLAVLLTVASLPAFADWEKGVAAYQKKDYRTAVKEFTDVTKTNPDYAGGYYMLGLAQSQLGQTSQALGNLRKAVELDGGNLQYKVALAQVLIQAKQYADAYSLLKKVNPAKLAARQKGLYALLFARAATKTNRPQEAIRVLEQQTRADPKNARLFQALGVAYNEAGNDAKAFRAFAKAFSLNPKDYGSGRSAAYAAIAAGRRASASAKATYYQEAASIAKKLASAKPTFEHLLLAGETLLGAKDYSSALSWFEKAAAKKPQNALVHFYMGQSYTQLGKYDTAIAELQKAIKLGADGKLRRQVYNQLGYIYDKKKNYDKAIEMYATIGNTSKVNEMKAKRDKQKQNLEAEQELREFRQKIAALEAQADELEKLGQMEDAQQLREQVQQLKAALKNR